jgi:tetratricopeptide (TPR) repeat protein
MVRPRLILEVAVLVAALGAARHAVASQPDTLARGIASFENLDDEQATRAFRQLLAEKPPREIAAKAHLYLGLIAFNSNSTEVAATEFKLALKANPAIELPPTSSPKARLLIGEARNELAGEIEQQSAQPPAAPIAATTPAVEVAAAIEPRHPRAAAIALGIAGILVGATAVYGGIQVLDYQGLVSSANASPRSVAGSQVVSAHGAAQFWAAAWIPLAAIGAGCFVATAFTW